ncbi:MAG: hypothetical protein L0323_01860 [Planctomycetes bacterium]|nr:hypothetical protein [Planctomycetota bacterium]
MGAPRSTIPSADGWESIRRQAEACRELTPEQVTEAFLGLLRLAEAQLAGAPDGDRAREFREPPHPSFRALKERLLAEQGLRPWL